MTREEIIEQLDGIIGTYEILIGNGVNSDILDVDDIEVIRETISVLSAEPCEDCISRQEAIRAIEALQRPIMREVSDYYQFKFSGMSEAREVVVNLPSVTPIEPTKTGHWIKSDIPNEEYVCSECGGACWYYDYEAVVAKSRFCPNCGAKMEG